MICVFQLALSIFLTVKDFAVFLGFYSEVGYGVKC